MNQIKAVVQSVQTRDSVSLLIARAAGIDWHTLLTEKIEPAAHLQTGQEVTLSFRESAVSLAKNNNGLLSIRNRIPCLVTDIQEGGILSTIRLNSNGLLLTSVITTAAVNELDLQEGEPVEALIKTTDIIIG